MNQPPRHGGRLREAARRYGIALEHWIDLSTGINPHPYPVPPVPPEVWQRLPEEDDGLETTAAHYYGNSTLLAVAGTQAAIQALPALLDGKHVTIATPSYAEHLWAWRHHAPHTCPMNGIADAVARSDVVVLGQPNNPCGTLHAPAQLLAWSQTLATRGGWLVVDEAFIDTTPEASVTPQAGQPGLIVLRSPGKFFGLAGARGGFVFAPPELLEALAVQLGPWAVSGPTRHALRAALADIGWQRAARLSLQNDGERLANLLQAYGFTPHGTALFQRVMTPHADKLAEHLAQQGILVRTLTEPAALRFGLPADERAWHRLTDALNTAPT